MRAPLILALALMGAGCTSAAQQAKQDHDKWCEAVFARINIMDYVDERTGKLDRSAFSGEILDPKTLKVAVTKPEEACIEETDHKIIGDWVGK